MSHFQGTAAGGFESAQSLGDETLNSNRKNRSRTNSRHFVFFSWQTPVDPVKVRPFQTDTPRAGWKDKFPPKPPITPKNPRKAVGASCANGFSLFRGATKPDRREAARRARSRILRKPGHYLAMEYTYRALEFVVLDRLKALDIDVAALAQRRSRWQFDPVSGSPVSSRDRSANRQRPRRFRVFTGNDHHQADLPAHSRIHSVDLARFSLHTGSRWRSASFGSEATSRRCRGFPR